MAVLFLMLVLLFGQIKSQKETILRTNWGVHFDEVGTIVSQHQVSYYVHSFAIPLPKIAYKISKTIDCTTNSGWLVLCNSINNVIQDINKQNYELFSTATKVIQDAISLVPKRIDYKRNKRNIFTRIGNAFTDLFHMPGHRDLELLKSHLQEVNAAMKLNSDSIKLFNEDLSSTQILLNNRVDILKEGLIDVERVISETTVHMNKTYNEFSNDFNSLLNKTNVIANVMDIVIFKLQSLMFRQQLLMQKLLSESQHWYQGIVDLYGGKISEFLIPLKFIANVIQHIKKNVLSLPKYTHMKLLSENLHFYTKQKDIIVTLHNKTLVAMMKFPLKNVGGLMKIYRAYSFPVPATSGLQHEKGKTYDSSYTLISNLPEYFAVTTGGDHYLTMSAAMYTSCDGNEVKICKLGMPSLQLSTSVTCISALFFDDKEGIHNNCTILRMKIPPTGSAMQLVGHDTFLIHGAHAGEDVWRLRCVKDGKYSQQSLVPCAMCQIKMPCFCTLGTNQFEINARMTECSNQLDKDGFPNTTYVNHPNLAMITSLFPDNILSKLKGYESKINHLYPSMNVTPPRIIHSNWSNIAEQSVSLEQDYKKIAKATYDNVIAYETKEDLIDKKVKDFSDVTVDRTTDLIKAVKDMFNIFGSFGHILGTIFSEFGLSVIALVFSSVMCMPILFWQLTECCGKSKKTPSAMIELKNCNKYNTKYKKLDNIVEKRNTYSSDNEFI